MPPSPSRSSIERLAARLLAVGALAAAGCSDDATCGPGAVGAPCTRTADCSQGVCLPSGRCSRPCAGTGDCPGSWSCSSLPGLGPVCSCTPRGAEVCNNLDDDCDASLANGCETGLLASTTNCGACGNRCAFANASAACGNGACEIGACSAGFGNCDRAASNGCESALNTVTNCGACGNRCNLANATAACTAGACTAVGAGPSLRIESLGSTSCAVLEHAAATGQGDHRQEGEEQSPEAEPRAFGVGSGGGALVRHRQAPGRETKGERGGGVRLSAPPQTIDAWRWRQLWALSLRCE